MTSPNITSNIVKVSIVTEFVAKQGLPGPQGEVGPRGDRVISAVSYTTSVTINVDITDILTITGQTGDLLFANHSGTAIDGKMVMIEIKDAGISVILTYGSYFANGLSNLIGATTPSKWSWMVVKWNATDSKWYCLASGTQP